MSQSSNIPSQGSFEIVLTKTIAGKPVLQNPVCSFSYHWDFETNTGQASLDAIDGTKVNITLFPTGEKGVLAFMSDMAPTGYDINGQQVVLNRVIMMIALPGGEHKAGIMFNDGSPIEVSNSWQNENNGHAASMIRRINPEVLTR